MSSYIQPLSRERIADQHIATALDGVQKSLGRIPNLFGVFAHTPVALDAYLQLSGITGKSRLSAAQREQIALAVATANDCDYCNAAHGALGKLAGLKPEQIVAARRAEAATPKDAALLGLAKRIVETRGKVPTSELDAFKSHGFDDAAILEVLVVTVLNLFTNYTNHLARTEIDFPQETALAA